MSILFDLIVVNEFNIVRFDDSYSRNRRFALQDYLRMIIRTFPFQENRNAFVDFLEIPSEALNQEDLSMYNQYSEQEAASHPKRHLFSHNDGLDEYQNECGEQNVTRTENDSRGNDFEAEGQWRDMEEDEEEGEEGQINSTSSSPVKQIVLSEESDSDDEAVEN